jgi:hypothetical protein
MSPAKPLAVLALATVLALTRHAGATPPDEPQPVYQPQAPPQPQYSPPPPPQYAPPQQPQYPYPPQPQYPYPPPQQQYEPQPQYPYPYQPQPAYAPQPQYQYQYQPPPKPRPYRDGDPIPVGYHVEERSRSGLVTGGWVLLLVPYGISALSAIGTRGDNATSWLYAPVIGPWFVLGNRNYSGCQNSTSGNGSTSNSANDDAGCPGDIFAVMGLIIDGILQAGGIAMLLVGYLDTKHVVVRDEPALRILPMRIGTGHGVGLALTF